MTDSEIPAGFSQKEVVKSLYRDASDFEQKREEQNRELPIEGPYGIVDPRYIGYTYLSYMFIETGEDLESARNADISAFLEHERDEALMMGICFGDYDVIHRRAEPERYTHAQFTVRSKENPELGFFNSIETYPIFTVGRWHGQEVNGDKTLDQETPSISPLEAEVLVQKIHSPNKPPSQILDDLRMRVENAKEFRPAIGEEIYSKAKRDIGEVVESLKENILIGKSISPTIANMGQHVTVGIKVEEREEDDDEDLPNEGIMNDLMAEFDGFEMPYIVSGVGQNWGDIIGEMYIEDVRDMNRKAQTLRNIDGIESTKTYLMTETTFNKPLLIDDPKTIPAIEEHSS